MRLSLHIDCPEARVHGGDAIRTAVASSTYPLPGAEVRYWVGRGWRVLEQGYDLPDVYVCSIEVVASGDTVLPIRCPQHDLYGFYVLAGSVRLTGAEAPTAVLDTAAGHYRLSYLPAAAYRCLFAAGRHHVFYFVAKGSVLFREASPELGADIAPVEALRARLGIPKVSASLSMAGTVGESIRRFLRHPGATYLRRYVAIQALVITLLLQACEALRAQPVPGQVGLSLAQRMRTYIDERVADGGDVDTASVARRFAVSYVYAKMIFRKHIGQPIGGYIRGCKLKQARYMLEAGDSPTQAARYVGWTPAYFSRAFRAKYGYPPGQHRNAISS